MSRRRSLVFYTGCFALVFCLGFLVFFTEGKSFVWKSDGYRQYYPALQYLGEYYRKVIKGLFTDLSSIPMIDYRIGQGEDIITTLANYGLGDPLTLFTVFVPARYTEYLYDFLIALRLYLSGLAFLAFCGEFKWDRRNSVLGALIYVFCGFAVWSIKDPFFLNALIYLPLILLGVERILRKKSPLVLAVSACLCAMSSYYFFYMIVLCSFAYFAVRACVSCGKNSKEIAKRGLWCLLAGLGGVMLGGITLFPVIYGFMESSRTGSYTSFASLFVYDFSYYRDIFSHFTAATGTSDADSVWYGQMAVVIFVTLCVLMRRKGRAMARLKYCVLLCLLAVLSPLAGYVLNGFGYITNRFMFIPAFLLSLIFVRLLPELLSLAAGEKKRLFLLAEAYSVCCLACLLWKGETLFPVLFMWIMLGATLACLFRIRDAGRRRRVLGILILLNLIGNMNLIYGGLGGNMINSYMDAGSVREAYTGDKAVNEAKRRLASCEGLTRADVMLHKGENPNQSVVAGFPGVSVYYSVINSAYCEYMTSLENGPDLMYSHRILGNDGRTILENLANVKYVASRYPDIVPYGYKQVEGKKNLYENTVATSIGYTYDSYVSEEDYDQADVFDRQDTLLSSAVLSQDSKLAKRASASGAVTKGAVREAGERRLDIDMRDVTHFDWREGRLTVDAANGIFRTDVTMSPGRDYYLRLTGLELVNGREDNLWAHVRIGKWSKLLIVASPEYDFYFGRRDYLIYLGHLTDQEADSVKKELKFRINGPAEYTLEDISLVEVPVGEVPQRVAAQNRECLQDVNIAGNGEVTGVFRGLTGDRLMCLAVPYKRGYTLTVNGRETEVEKINKLYMGAWLPSGDSSILLCYTTPGLRAGAAFSLFGSVFIVVLCIVHRRRILK